MNHLSRCFAPAKINLFLHVVGRRLDGYHLLQSVFQLIDWGDWLDFELRHDGDVVLATPLPGVPPELDLTVRAARLLQAETKTSYGVTIHLEKHLPLGGGLGGGSSDAATVLLALNQLWNLGLSRDRLMSLGLRLGADVPFFVFGENAFVEGVGEQLCAIQTPVRQANLLVPHVSVPTPHIFNSALLCRDTLACTFDEVQSAYQGGDLTFGHNDLEPVALALFPALQAAIDSASSMISQPTLRMSGSGASFFGLPDVCESHGNAVVPIAAPLFDFRCVSFLQQSPMRGFA